MWRDCLIVCTHSCSAAHILHMCIHKHAAVMSLDVHSAPYGERARSDGVVGEHV